MTKLRHCPCFDLANALTGETEVLANLFEGAGLTTVEAKAKFENLTFALVEWSKQPGNFLGKQRRGGNLERGISGAILDNVAEFGVAIFTKRLGEREGFGREAKCFGDFVLGHLDLGRELGQRCWTTKLEF